METKVNMAAFFLGPWDTTLQWTTPHAACSTCHWSISHMRRQEFNYTNARHAVDRDYFAYYHLHYPVHPIRLFSATFRPSTMRPSISSSWPLLRLKNVDAPMHRVKAVLVEFKGEPWHHSLHFLTKLFAFTIFSIFMNLLNIYSNGKQWRRVGTWMCICKSINSIKLDKQATTWRGHVLRKTR